MRKIGLIFSIIIISAIAFWGYQRLDASDNSADPVTDMQIVEVKRGAVVATVFVVGNVVPSREANVAYSSVGTLKEVNVEVGDYVETGQALALLDTTDLEWEIASSELDLTIKEAELAQLKANPSSADLVAAAAALDSAQATVDSIHAGPSQAELNSARAALQAAQSNYEQVNSKPNADTIRQAELQLEHAKNNLWHAQTERDIACDIETKSRSLCDSYEAEVGNGHVEIQMAELALEQAKLPATEAEVQTALAQVQQAQESLNALLADPDPAAMAAAEAQVVQAQAQLDKLNTGPSAEQLRIAEARIDQTKLALQRVQQNLKNATLVAPFEGTVTTVSYRVGDVVRPELPGITLADLSRLEIRVSVAEIEISQIQIGQQAEVVLDALSDRTIIGHVTSIAPGAHSEQGVVNYPVTISLADNDADVKPGMTGNVSIIVGRRENVLFVPNRAIRQSRGQRLVIVSSQDQFNERQIQTGLSNDSVTEVIGDLEEGDRVVLNPTTVQSGLSGGLFQSADSK